MAFCQAETPAAFPCRQPGARRCVRIVSVVRLRNLSRVCGCSGMCRQEFHTSLRRDLDRHLEAKVLLVRALERLEGTDPERVERGIGGEIRRGRLAGRELLRMLCLDAEGLMEHVF